MSLILMIVLLLAPAGSTEWEVVDTFGEDSLMAFAVIECESRWNPRTVNRNSNGTTDRGLFQLNSVTWAEITRRPYSQAFHPSTNIAMAKRLYDVTGDFRRWSCWWKLHGCAWQQWDCLKPAVVLPPGL